MKKLALMILCVGIVITSNINFHNADSPGWEIYHAIIYIVFWGIACLLFFSICFNESDT